MPAMPGPKFPPSSSGPPTTTTIREEVDDLDPDQESPPLTSSSSSFPSRLACVINSEIAAVLAVMRRNVSWSGGRYSSDPLDHSLLLSLKSLRRKLFSSPPSLGPAAYLRPFLDVIRSDETGAPITGVALSSVYKILSLDTLDPKSTPGVDQAMRAVVDAVTSCRFEVTDPASEEAVLMKILQVLLACLKSRAGAVLSNQHVCTIMNTCFRVVHQAGTKGELLQRISRHSMHELVRCIFARLPEVAGVDGDKSGRSSGKPPEVWLKAVTCSSVVIIRCHLDIYGLSI